MTLRERLRQWLGFDQVYAEIASRTAEVARTTGAVIGENRTETLNAMREHVLGLEKQIECLDDTLRAVSEQERVRAEAAAEAAKLPAHDDRLACTCGFTHFTPGGQNLVVGKDGRLHPSGAVLSCLKCGTRWAACDRALVEPHPAAMPPAWAAQDLQRSVARATSSGANSEDLKRIVRKAVGASATQHFRTPPRTE